MLMPTLSVTIIGVLVALGAVAVRHASLGRALLFGLAGAWAGFLAGALVGVVIDVVAGTGWMLALSGHVAALAAAVALVAARFGDARLRDTSNEA